MVDGADSGLFLGDRRIAKANDSRYSSRVGFDWRGRGSIAAPSTFGNFTLWVNLYEDTTEVSTMRDCHHCSHSVSEESSVLPRLDIFHAEKSGQVEANEPRDCSTKRSRLTLPHLNVTLRLHVFDISKATRIIARCEKLTISIMKRSGWTTSEPLTEGEERNAFVELNPSGFFIRHPPAPHELQEAFTDEETLFQTIHMGGAVVDNSKWRLLVMGMVSNPFSISLSQLQALPSKTITSFHECYGSPLQPPTKALRRIGNVTWTGVPLHLLLDHAGVKPGAKFVWSEGLDRGSFAKVDADRYQKDLPIAKAMAEEVLIAYQMNDEPLSKNRGGPVRLVVPGWFGTNATKWLCKIEVQGRRAPGPFTTIFYNERHPPDDPDCKERPVWKVQPNSMITRPMPESSCAGSDVLVEGWAWSEDGVKCVDISLDEGRSWISARVEERTDFSWQKFKATLQLEPGDHTLLARATGMDGRSQPLGEGRNHVHRVPIKVT